MSLLLSYSSSWRIPTWHLVKKWCVRFTWQMAHTRFFRLRASFEPAVADFWYDSQTPQIIIQSADRNQDYIITTKDWDLANSKTKSEGDTGRPHLNLLRVTA